MTQTNATLLAIDVGNTRLKWALFEKPCPGAERLAHGTEFLENIDGLAEGEWASLPAPQRIIGCVVAGLTTRLRVEEQLEIWPATPHWVISSEAEAGLRNGYEHPARLGSDRWVAMIGAWHRVQAAQPGRPIVLAMVGTAVTVEAIDGDGNFLGGFILPGHGIMLHALEAGTAGLRVPTGRVLPFPRNTSDALTSGGTFAIAGAIERMVLQVKEHCGEHPVCLMTGGAGWKMAPAMTLDFEVVEGLIFDGLLEIAAHRFPPAPDLKPG